MKEIVSYVRKYIREEVNFIYLIILAVLLTGLAVLFYSDKALMQSVGGGANDNGRLLNNILLYCGTVIGAFILAIPFNRHAAWVRDPSFWLTVFGATLIYAFSVFFYWHKEWIKTVVSGPDQIFWLRTSRSLATSLLTTIPVTVWWLISDRKRQEFYGFRKTDLKPYFVLLLCFLPLLIAAGFSDSFVKQYPQISRTLTVAGITENKAFYVGIFEPCYAFGYFATELFFRGFLIAILFRKAGYACILPVAAFYVTIHFGKPVGETIGSFFGAVILGVITANTKSIWGGVIIHVGIALGMEVVAGVARMIS